MVEPVENEVSNHHNQSNNRQGLDYAGERDGWLRRRLGCEQRDYCDQRDRSKILKKQDGKCEAAMARRKLALFLKRLQRERGGRQGERQPDQHRLGEG